MTKVAIFETDHAFAVELRTELTRFGCTVQVFTDGSSGLSAAKSAPPDLILVSAELPPVNGFSTCNKIKKDAKLASVPIILMSSQSSAETFEQHRRLPSRADDYVHKPISFADFLPHIQKLVHLESSGHRIADDDTSMVMDEEVLIVEDSAFDDVGPETESTRPALELDINGATDEGTDRRPITGAAFDETESMDEELATVVGERPNIPEHLLEQYRAAMKGSGPADMAGAKEAEVSGAAAPSAHPTAQSTPPPVPPVRAAQSSVPLRTGPPPVPPARPAQSSVPLRTGPPPAAGTWSSTPMASTAPPGQPGNADLVRAKNALQAALTQLNQSRKEAATLREQLAATQSQGAETDRLRQKLDQAKAAEKEVLDLREHMQVRDKELVSMRETLAVKEREVLASKDAALNVERSMTDVKERLGHVEAKLGTAKARVEALSADKALADKRADDFKTGARKIAEQLNQRAKELAELTDGHNVAMERLKREHQTERTQSDEKHRVELADLEGTHREQLARATSQHQEQVGQAELTNQTQLGEAKSRVEQALKEAEAKIATANREAEEKIARAQNEADAKLKQTIADASAVANQKAQGSDKTYAKKLDQLEKQLELAHLETEEFRTLADDAKETIEASLSDQQALEEQHEKTVATMTHEHRNAVGTLEERLTIATEEHAKAKRGLEVENAKALQKAGYDYQEKLLQKETSLASLKEQLEAELTDANQDNAQLKTQLQQANDAAQLERRESDNKVATLTAERADLEAQVKQQQPVAATLADVEAKLTKARVRWGEERAELKQVKNALAGLVRTLDEAVIKNLEE